MINVDELRNNFAKDCIISIERLNYTFSKIEK